MNGITAIVSVFQRNKVVDCRTTCALAAWRVRTWITSYRHSILTFIKEKEKERQEREEIERELERIRSLKSDHKCLNSNCKEFARKGSKFCSHECGITHAMEMIQQKEREDEANRKREIESKKLKEHEELVNAIKQQQEQLRLQQETLTAQSITTFTVADKEVRLHQNTFKYASVLTMNRI